MLETLKSRIQALSYETHAHKKVLDETREDLGFREADSYSWTGFRSFEEYWGSEEEKDYWCI